MRALRLTLCALASGPLFAFACGLVCVACAPEPGLAPSTPTATSGTLPKRLSPRHIRRGVGAIMGYARGCGFRYRVPGHYRVHVVLSGATGRPIRVTVLNRSTHRATEHCVIDAFKRARFQRFRDRTQRFIFPVIFR